MSLDQLLREAAPDSHRVANHVESLRGQVIAGFVDTALPTAVTNRPVRNVNRMLVGGATAAVLGLGGIAYATGTFPFPLEQPTAGPFAGKDMPEMVQIVDLALPDGTRFAAWRGTSDSMQCTGTVDGWDGEQQAQDSWGSVSCTEAESAAIEANRVQIVWSGGSARTSDGDLATWYPVLFGDTDSEASQVRVFGTFASTGGWIDQTVPISGSTGAFGFVLPGDSANPWRQSQVAGFKPSGLSMRFLNEDGEVLSSRPGPEVTIPNE